MRKLLEDTDGIIGAQNGNRAGEPDVLGPGRDRGQCHRRRGHEEVRPVVLAHSEEIEAELISEHRLLEQLAHPLLRTDA